MVGYEMVGGMCTLLLMVAGSVVPYTGTVLRSFGALVLRLGGLDVVVVVLSVVDRCYLR